MKKHYSRNIAGAISQFFRCRGMAYTFDAQKGLGYFLVGILSRWKELQCCVEIMKDGYQLYAFPPVSADADDKEQMAALGEYLHRVNYDMTEGCVGLNMDGGEIYFRINVDLRYRPPTDRNPMDEIMGESMMCAALTFEQYGDEMSEVMEGKLSPKDAFQKAKREWPERLKKIQAQYDET